MRHHRSVLFVTGLFLVVLAGCAADSMRSSSEPSSTSQVAQAPDQITQHPSGAAQESSTMQPLPGTALSPSTAPMESGLGTQAEPPSGEVQERGVPLKPLPGVTAPAPSGMAPPPGFVGATDNITKVGRAIQVRAKSLTMLVTVAPGVSITQPVTISIALGGYGPTRQTQSYVPSTGNHFLYNDPEGDGKPRRAFADITLTEPKPGGGVYTSTIPGSVMLDPLYDVTISSLQFSLIENCDVVGRSEIVFLWYTPDAVTHSDIKKAEFLTTASGKLITLPQFAWARPEVSASAKLHVLWLGFYESDPGYKPGIGQPPTMNLVPGKTQRVVLTEKEMLGDCRAHVEYTITYTLRWYPYL